MSCWFQGGPSWLVLIAIGVQGMPNALLNQEVNAFMRPKSKLETAQSSSLGVQDEGQRENALAQFYRSRRDCQSDAVAKRGNKSPTQSTNSRGKVTSFLDWAAAGQLLVCCDQVQHPPFKTLETIQGMERN